MPALVLAFATTVIIWRVWPAQAGLPRAAGPALAQLSQTTGSWLEAMKQSALSGAGYGSNGRGGLRLEHDEHVPIEGGLLIAPQAFAPADGRYDLIVHFHGNTAVVRQSVDHVRLNAALAIVNLGIRSRPYREAYEAQGTYERLLAEIGRGLRERGVRNPRLRRVALSAWSAGYGAVDAILRNRLGDDPLDAILLLDALHAGWQKDRFGEINTTQLEPFVSAARAATAGQILFSLTYSEIDPKLFAGTAQTADYLLRTLELQPDTHAMQPKPTHVQLEAFRDVLPAAREHQLVPLSDTRVGDLRLRGFRGKKREHHMAHLLQMAATTLLDLRERWDADGAHRAATTATPP